MKITVQPGDIVKLFGIEKSYAMIGNAGFDGIDMNLNHSWNNEEVKNRHLGYCVFEEDMEIILKHYEKELEAIKKNGLKIFQAHAPFPSYVDGFPELSLRVPKIYNNCIRFCKEAGIPYLVIHGISRLYDGSDMTRSEMIQKNIELYSSMISTLKETGVTVLLENLFWCYNEKSYDATCADPKEAVEIIDKLNLIAGADCFGLCFDAGHNNLLKWDIESYIRLLGNRIKALHLHDNDGNGDWHMIPCTGTVRWDKLCSLLCETGYSGTINFETFSYYDLRRVMPEAVPAILKYLVTIGKEFGAVIEQK